MTLFCLCSWEYNGRDDSDWYSVVYDSEKDSIYRVETGTTRFANALYCGPAMSPPTDDVMIKAMAANLRFMLPIINEQEVRRVMEPYSSLINGTKVKLLTTARFMEKEVTPCLKCNGSGKWVNPNRETDQRICFACNGAGEIQGKKVKTAAGKQQWKYIPEGMVGTIVDSKVWGTFYRNGYNHPDRSNTRFLIKFEDGTTSWISGVHLRLESDIRSDDEVIMEWKNKGGETDFYTQWRSAR